MNKYESGKWRIRKEYEAEAEKVYQFISEWEKIVAVSKDIYLKSKLLNKFEYTSLGEIFSEEHTFSDFLGHGDERVSFYSKVYKAIRVETNKLTENDARKILRFISPYFEYIEKSEYVEVKDSVKEQLTQVMVDWLIRLLDKEYKEIRSKYAVIMALADDMGEVKKKIYSMSSTFKNADEVEEYEEKCLK